MTETQRPSPGGLPPEIAAWRDFCRRMEALGERLLAPEFPQAPADRVEGIAHLAEQVSCWLGWSFGHGDPRAPFFHRSNDLVTQWGGPNQDNTYHHARIDPAFRYRIRGKMHSCHDFVLTLRAGFTAFFWLGKLIEFDRTDRIFTAPAEKLTEDYVTGRCG